MKNDKTVMNAAKNQVKQAIHEMKDYLRHGTKKQKEFANRNIPEFEQMLELFNPK
ncbi:hypothetical protein AAG747_18210 [Rapidithrix thailandica]|uniref:Uncharacterized protein n=1 Tax=Rapidithrix thailandica TaxID=413964 RepID=A0AAW9S3T4_9BACT